MEPTQDALIGKTIFKALEPLLTEDALFVLVRIVASLIVTEIEDPKDQQTVANCFNDGLRKAIKGMNDAKSNRPPIQ